MGFGTTTIVSQAIAYASDLFTDFTPLIAIFVGVAIVGLMFSIYQRFSK